MWPCLSFKGAWEVKSLFWDQVPTLSQGSVITEKGDKLAVSASSLIIHLHVFIMPWLWVGHGMGEGPEVSTIKARLFHLENKAFPGKLHLVDICLYLIG